MKGSALTLCSGPSLPSRNYNPYLVYYPGSNAISQKHSSSTVIPGEQTGGADHLGDGQQGPGRPLPLARGQAVLPRRQAQQPGLHGVRALGAVPLH